MTTALIIAPVAAQLLGVGGLLLSRTIAGRHQRRHELSDALVAYLAAADALAAEAQRIPKPRPALQRIARWQATHLPAADFWAGEALRGTLLRGWIARDGRYRDAAERLLVVVPQGPLQDAVMRCLTTMRHFVPGDAAWPAEWRAARAELQDVSRRALHPRRSRIQLRSGRHVQQPETSHRRGPVSALGRTPRASVASAFDRTTSEEPIQTEGT